MRELVLAARDKHLARNIAAVERMRSNYELWGQTGRIPEGQDERFRQFSKLVADMTDVSPQILTTILDSLNIRGYTFRDCVILTQLLADQPVLSEVDKCLIDFPLRYKMKNKMKNFVNFLAEEEHSGTFKQLADTVLFDTYEQDSIIYVKYKHIYEFKTEAVRFFMGESDHTILDMNPKELLIMIDPK